MKQPDNFLHTTHRTITWFNKTFLSNELDLAPPFQRHAVWTNLQKSYLLDTVLSGLPIPELYMQDIGNEAGEEKHVVVDGQQRVRAVIDFVQGRLTLQGDDVARKWRGLKFNDLDVEDKKSVFGYKFVVRILPPDLKEEDIRRVFARLNKNVVSLTDQELRNATYWGPFIRCVQFIADEDPFWTECGVFSANDYRRMNDHEYVSELVVAYLHGPQNKKDKLDTYYLLYEEQFEDREVVIATFRKVTSEIARMLQSLSSTRWKKKSDFYTLFLQFAERQFRIPFDDDKIVELERRIVDFGARVDSALRLDENNLTTQDDDVFIYARALSDHVASYPAAAK